MLTQLRTKYRYTYVLPWWVMDMDTGKVAAKTSKTGYPTKQEAVRVAREYRDRYGAYVKAPF
jgi:hypothetical protein